MSAIQNPPYVLDGSSQNHGAALFRQMLAAAHVSPGVDSYASLLATADGATMYIALGDGGIFIPSGESTPPELYFGYADPSLPTSVTIKDADPTQARQDIIVAYVYDTHEGAIAGDYSIVSTAVSPDAWNASDGSTVADVWGLGVVTGTPGGGDPTLPPTALPLWRVTVPAAAAALIQADLTDLRQISTPRGATGTVDYYAGPAAPYGALVADGSAVSRAGEAALFARIGTRYGIGDGSTTFNLPNLTNRVAVGSGGTYALASNGGAATVTLSTGQIPSHTHPLTDPGHGHTGSLDTPAGAAAPTWMPFKLTGAGEKLDTGGNSSRITFTSDTSVSVNSHTTGITEAAAGGGGAHNNMQPYVALLPIIWT